MIKTRQYLSILCVAIFLLSSPGIARDTSYIDEIVSSAKLQGSGRLTWWGLNIYDASFYRIGSSSSSDFALDMRYQRSFRGITIANRTVEEMKRTGVPENQAIVWGEQLAAFLPNVESGQTLTAVYIPNAGTIFYHDGKRIAQIPGADFSRAFFGIWLDPKTSAPKLREQLLGQGCLPPLFSEPC